MDDATTALAGIGLSALVTGAMMAGSSILLLVSSVIPLAVALLSPMVGLIVLASVAPLPRPTIVPPPGIWVVMIGAIIAGLILRLPIDRPRLRRPSAELLLTGAFLAYLGTHIIGGALDGGTNIAGRGLTDSLQRQTDLATGLLAFAVALVVLRDRSPWPLVAALLVSAGVAASSALLPMVGIEGIFDNVADPVTIASRAAGFFFDPNYFAAYLAAAATLGLACATFVTSRKLRGLLIVAAAAYSIALVATLSRGGLLALAAGLLTVAFVRSRKAGVVALCLLVLLFILAYPLFSDARFGESGTMAGVGLTTQLESAGRIGTWLAGIDLFWSSPVFGVGFGQYVEASSAGIAPHNWYIGVLAEGGIVGFGLWMLLIGAMLRSLRRTSHPAQTIGYAVIATWLVASLFLDTPRFYRPTGLVLFAVAAALSANWLPRISTRSGAGIAEPASGGPEGDYQRIPRRSGVGRAG